MRSCLYFLLFVILVSPVWAQAPLTQEDRIQKLEQTIQAQDQKIQNLQKKLNNVEQPSREYTEQIVKEYMNRPEAQDATTISAGYEDKGFFIRTPDGKFELYMSGFMQMGLGLFENRSYENASFYPNGLSIAFDMWMHKNWHARLQLNFLEVAQDKDNFVGGGAGPSDNLYYNKSKFYKPKVDQVKLWDAYIEYLPMPEVAVCIGNQIIPFAIEAQYDPQQQMAIWLDPFSNWSPVRELGIQVYGTLEDVFEYRLGFYNGENTGINKNDDMMFVLAFNSYLFGKTDHPGSFFHLGILRNRLAEGTYVDSNGDGAVNGDDTFTDFSAVTFTTPWGRRVFGGNSSLGWRGNSAIEQRRDNYDVVAGWQTGFDCGFKFDEYMDDNKIDRLRIEVEYMFMDWERETGGRRMPHLQGTGLGLGIMWKHNLTPEIESAGIFPVLKFSYTKLDNKQTNHYSEDTFQNPIGQTELCYTIGLGYSFNKHITANFNWVIVDLDEKELYGGPKKNTGNQSGSLEQAVFFQLTAQW